MSELFFRLPPPSIGGGFICLERFLKNVLRSSPIRATRIRTAYMCCIHHESVLFYNTVSCERDAVPSAHEQREDFEA